MENSSGDSKFLIFKCGDRGGPVKNYRPSRFSFISCISKVLEKLVHSKTSEFIS